MIISYRVSCIPTAISTPDSFTNPWVFRSPCSPYFLPYRAHPAGSRNGKKCCSTPSRKFLGLARFIWATPCAALPLWIDEASCGLSTYLVLRHLPAPLSFLVPRDN